MPILKALLAWLVSLALPAIETSQEVFKGITLFLLGFATLLTPQLAIDSAVILSWHSNWIFFFALFAFYKKKYGQSFYLSLAGAILALSILFFPTVPLGPEFEKIHYKCRIGVYIWTLSMMYLALVSNKKNKKRGL